VGPLAQDHGGVLWVEDPLKELPEKESMIDVRVGRTAGGSWSNFIDGVFLWDPTLDPESERTQPKAKHPYRTVRDFPIGIGYKTAMEAGAAGWAVALLLGDRLMIDAARRTSVINELTRSDLTSLYQALFDADGVPIRVPNPRADESLIEPPFVLSSAAMMKLGRIREAVKVSEGRLRGPREAMAKLEAERSVRQQVQSKRQGAVSAGQSEVKAQWTPRQRELERRKSVPSARKRQIFGPLGAAYIELGADGVWRYRSDDGTLELAIARSPRAPEERDLMMAVKGLDLDAIELDAGKRGSDNRRPRKR
jgi:hypothetical protein